MAIVGWTAFGTLCTKLLAVANSWIEVQDYTALAIAVCASSAALIALSEQRHRLVGMPNADAATLRLEAGQMLFPENRRRLLALAQRLEERRSPS
jgi:hypothetical protein